MNLLLTRATRFGIGLLVCLSVAAAFAAGDHVQRVELSDDFQAVTVFAPDGAVLLTYAIAAWRAWAEEHLEEALGGPVTVGEVELPASTFYAFGHAEVTTDGTRVLLVATTYAMLTTASVLTLLDPASLALEVVADVAYGDVESTAWSADGRLLAFALGSARASGDGLNVDDLASRRRILELDARSALASDAGAALGAVVDGFEWFPAFRDVAWADDGALVFVTNDPAAGPEEGELRWRFDPGSGELRVE
jgi:hypothetical protein